MRYNKSNNYLSFSEVSNYYSFTVPSKRFYSTHNTHTRNKTISFLRNLRNPCNLRFAILQSFLRQKIGNLCDRYRTKLQFPRIDFVDGVIC